MASASQNALTADSVLEYMSKSLPAKHEAAASIIKDPYAAIALFCHSCMLAVGFRLIGLGEDHKIGMTFIYLRAESNSLSVLEAQSDPSNVSALPTEWDASSSYAFRYAHSESSMEFLVKVSRLGEWWSKASLRMGLTPGEYCSTCRFRVM
jgi:hypothetical protein